MSDLATRSARAGRDGLALAQQRLDSRSARAGQAGRRSIERAEQQLEARITELPKLADRILRTAATDLGHIEARLRASDPAVLLARGWSITRTTKGNVVRTVTDVVSGDTLVTEVADGSVISTASFVDPSASADSAKDPQ